MDFETIGIMPGFIRIKNLPGERWKEIKNYPNYMVSTKGRVMRIEHEYVARNGMSIYYAPIILQPITSKNGYLYVNLNRGRKMKHHYIHRLVAEAFIPNIKGLPQVNHIDEDKTNNCVENLEWCTAEENVNHGGRNQRSSETLKGRKVWSEERRLKMSQDRTGKPKTGRRVECNGLSFSSIRFCAEHLGESSSNVRGWLCGAKPMPKKYKDMGLKYVTNDKTMRYKQFHDIVIYDGIFDVNIVDAMLQTNKNLIFLNVNDLKDAVSMLVDGSGKLISFKRIYNKYFA